MFSLGFRKVRGDLIYTCRILSGMNGEDMRGYFSTVSYSSTRGHRWKLLKQRRLRFDTCMVLSSRVVNLWNALSAEVIKSTMEAEFKRRLDSYFRLRTDYCQMCSVRDLILACKRDDWEVTNFHGIHIPSYFQSE